MTCVAVIARGSLATELTRLQRLNSLLTSSDLDVVVADLKLLLRPSQQYSSAPPSAQTSNISSSRLLALSQSWSALRDQGVELHEIMDAKRTDVDVDLSGPAGDVHFQFYRKATDKVTDKPTATETTSALSTGTPSSPQARTTKPASGAVNIHIPGVASSDQSDMTILAEAMESYNIPEDERFALLCKIRMAKVLPKGREVERENLLVVRLLAISIYGTQSLCFLTLSLNTSFQHIRIARPRLRRRYSCTTPTW